MKLPIVILGLFLSYFQGFAQNQSPKIVFECVESLETKELKQSSIDSLAIDLLKIQQMCALWLKKHRKDFDLNQYKRTQRFQTALKTLYQRKNLNKFPFQANQTLVFIDSSYSILGIDCGMKVLQDDKIHRGDFLNYIVVFDYAKYQIIKVLIYNTGYFLE